MLCPMLLSRFSKRDLSLTACILAIAAHSVLLLNLRSFTLVLVSGIVPALGEAPLTAIAFGMMGDVVEYGQWKTHIRQKALICGSGITRAIITKLVDARGCISFAGVRGPAPKYSGDDTEHLSVWTNTDLGHHRGRAGVLQAR